MNKVSILKSDLEKTVFSLKFKDMKRRKNGRDIDRLDTAFIK